VHYLVDRKHIALMNKQLKKRYLNKENVKDNTAS
jgi:hypothetical protein